MPGLGCYSSFEAIRWRTTLLTETGAPDPGANAVVTTDALIQVGWQVQVREGARLEIPNGSGGVCAVRQQRDVILGVNVTFEMCKLDMEHIELMTGYDLINIDGDDVGVSLPDANTELTRQVGVEAWSLAWDGDEQAVADDELLTIRWVWPRLTVRIGDGTLTSEGLRVPFSGKGTSNSQWGNGPANDIPWNAIAGPMGFFYDRISPPESVCGYQTLLAS